MSNLLQALVSSCLVLGLFSTANAQSSSSAVGLERVVQELVAPPFLPAHEQVATGNPKVVQVRMVIEEKLIDIDQSGAKIWAMTFNGSVPGPIIVVHQDDYVELTLVNPKTNNAVAQHRFPCLDRCPGWR